MPAGGERERRRSVAWSCAVTEDDILDALTAIRRLLLDDPSTVGGIVNEIRALKG